VGNVISDEWCRETDYVNNEFGGRTLIHCDCLNGNQFAVTPGALRACCLATHSKGTPTICKHDQPVVSPKAYLNGLAQIIRDNQTKDGPCIGCRYLTKRALPDKFIAQTFYGISLHDYCGCNAKCVYCSGSEYYLKEKYVASFDHEILFSNLLAQNKINSDTTISWGGGEPTLLKSFERTVEFFTLNKMKQIINTSGILYSPSVEKALKCGLSTVRISVDSGTSETYALVKGNPYYEKVWETIKSYATAGDSFIVKYIVFSMNSNRGEIEAFIGNCCSSGVKSVCISVDARSVYSIESSQPEITFKELSAAAQIYNACRKNNINASFESIWTPAQLAEITKLCNETDLVQPGIVAKMISMINKLFTKDV